MDKGDAKKICKCLAKGECQEECRQYIDYPDEHNCTLISIHENGQMTLREIAERLNLSHVWVRRLENKALKKIKKNVV